MKKTEQDTNILSPKQLELRMGKSRREGYGLLGNQGRLPGGEGHWSWVLKAEQELSKHSWVFYPLG